MILKNIFHVTRVDPKLVRPFSSLQGPLVSFNSCPFSFQAPLEAPPARMSSFVTVSLDDSDVLWYPSSPDVEQSATIRLLSRINNKYLLKPPLESYESLYRWSVDPKTLGAFWSTVWDEVAIIGDKGEYVIGDSIDESWDEAMAPVSNPPWFRDAKVNWAENMLGNARTEGRRDKTALIQVGKYPAFHSIGTNL